MVKIFKALRGLLVGVVAFAIIVPVALYIILSSSWGSNIIREISERELTGLLGTDVNIGNVKFSPFNRLRINDVTIDDDYGKIAAAIKEIDMRYEFWDLITKHKIIIDYATVDSLDLKLYKDSVSAPLNIAKIIDRLSSKDENKPETIFKLRLNDVNLNNCSFSYDVFSEPETPQRFNPSHIALSQISLSAFAPVISNDEYQIRLRNLTVAEQSGIIITELSTNVNLTQHQLEINDLRLQTPNSLLSFADMSISIDSIKSIGNIGKVSPINISIAEGSHIYLPDFEAFVPAFESLDYDINIALDATGTRQWVNVEDLSLIDGSGTIALKIAGMINNIDNADALSFENLKLSLKTDTTAILETSRSLNIALPERARTLIGAMAYTTLEGELNGSPKDCTVAAALNSSIARANVNGHLMHTPGSSEYHINGEAKVDSLSLNLVTGNADFGNLSGTVNLDGTLNNSNFIGNVDASINKFDYKGYRYHNIDAIATINNSKLEGELNVSDPNVGIDAKIDWTRHIADIKNNVNPYQTLDLNIHLTDLRLDSLRLSSKYPGYNLRGLLNVQYAGESIDRCIANIRAQDVTFRNITGDGLTLNDFEIIADNIGGNGRPNHGRINIISDYINGTVDGSYKITTLPTEIKDIFYRLLPALANHRNTEQTDIQPAYNNFSYDFTLSNCEDLCEFFKFPVTIIDHATLQGNMNSVDQSILLQLDAPWIEQGSNIIENTALAISLKGDERTGDVFVTSLIPTKKGDMDVSAHTHAIDGRLDTRIDWSIIRTIPINGAFDFSTIFSRDEDNELVTQINFNPGEINFGDENWAIQKSTITYGNKHIFVNNFALIAETQSLKVNGIAGTEETDRLTIDLNNIELIDIFETLEIDNAMIGGYATGTIHGSALLGSNPVIKCDHLSVKDIGYNRCTLGDADVRLSLDDGGRIFNFDADITESDGRHSFLDGFIVPATEELNINIKADRVKVGFMKPFMSAFTSDVSGYASGTARLYGTFKDIDMIGDIYAQDLHIKIDFTNTWYNATDSIHIRPGIINLSNIKITDDYGNSAMLNGWVAHKYFHNASFDFSITDAHNLLSYDVTEQLNPDWYGRIFGNGSATVKGKPGVVDIGVSMSTAANSTFTFVLSDMEEADEYQFITFRDATPHVETDSILERDITPERVILSKLNKNNNVTDDPTAYNMDISIDITPQAQLIIVMDPIGGDRIRANGSGHLRMTYESINNDLRLYGTYTLDRGNYNFTLQDIIIKDFTIKEGSSITFLGDPYSAQLDINAYNQVNANLSDLDESFLQDKDLNRTNVPVRALLIVKGDMRQPDISFDLEFPTLQQDTYRKVRSIVSTEDMMTRQIIYLLALNRFYTPEYMASTTKGNELFSVASSTLSSQLSSMLGKLSDNWSIAPNLRSDRGDFSDIEVDLTLSSSLLNNRLLLNGNFGYRDKSLNTNQFVGDFDLEYLLDRSGEWRLKAYNRYNDQNYYLRTAQTTQGIGVVYRRDFDKTFRFLKRLKKDNDSDTTIIKLDSIKSDNTEVKADSIKSPPHKKC